MIGMSINIIGLDTDTRDDIPVYLPEKERAPENKTVYIPDAHGNVPFALDSLEQAKVLKRKGERGFRVLRGEEETEITFLGDEFDRGPEGLNILRLIDTLRQQIKNVRLLAADHELMTIGGMKGYQRIKKIWLDPKNGGNATLQNLRDETGIQDDESSEFKAAASSIFFEGKIGDVLSSMQFCAQNGAVLSVHAGVNDFLATLIAKSGVKGAQEFFRKNIFDIANINERKLEMAITHSGDISEPFWMRQANNPNFMTSSRASMLNEAGIYTIVRGHEAKAGNPRMEILPGDDNGGTIRFIHLDAGSGSDNRWTYLRMWPDGRVKADSHRGNGFEIRKESI